MNVNFEMWAFKIIHMVAYLCAILCSIINIQGNISKQWTDNELKALCYKNIEKCLRIMSWVNKEEQRDPT